MNAPRDSIPETGSETYLFASSNGSHITWLTDALGSLGSVVVLAPDTKSLDERIALLGPVAVFIDFSPEQSAMASQLHQRLKRDWPTLPVLATGTSAEPAAMLSALRAGVDDFIDMAAASTEAVITLRALLDRRGTLQGGTRGSTLALLGARAGLGVTTLATSLALTLNDQLVQAPARPPGRSARHGVALLDLGLPARDGLLYLDTQSGFSFVDGVRNLRRLDQTLLHTALAHHSSGVAVLPLPASLAQVREISHADSVTLIKRLADFFDFQIADLGGFSTLDFVAQTVREAQQAWVVCDQSIGGIVSTANMLKELRTRGVETDRLALVVNKFDSHVGLPAKDIAERLELPLRHVLPSRSAQLLAAASRGEMLVRTARGDPYAQAVTGIARGLHQEYISATGQPPAKDPRWVALKSQLTGFWKSSHEG
ncbi:pilus assembly protein CpaE [Variovorax boronicumulans]|uniref:histidine kinase n=1 Tax=Variovorax boronicumulans TaxID=436515 RepID=UPI00277E5ADD|nr:histidine kinase [Variovorax boronicumulans]MDP9990579.1 pilus assembly protein CpaE [Variovorax boronicumulans]MDQ0000910.1 pilus assembly protein CpaE [Variovorax boronicumulans]